MGCVIFARVLFLDKFVLVVFKMLSLDCQNLRKLFGNNMNGKKG